MYRIYEELNIEHKIAISEKILRLLPEWFGLEDCIKYYIEEAKSSTFLVSESNGIANGFISVRTHNNDSAEIVSMGVLKDYHGKGIGKQLVDATEESMKDKGIKLLQVKTLGPSANCEYYEQTRAFYSSRGFLNLEENHEIWGVENPCLIMVKAITK